MLVVLVGGVWVRVEAVDLVGSPLVVGFSEWVVSVVLWVVLWVVVLRTVVVGTVVDGVPDGPVPEEVVGVSVGTGVHWSAGRVNWPSMLPEPP